LILAMAAALADQTPATTTRTHVDHRGERYAVDYHAVPHVRHKTVGMAAPARPSHERCEETLTVLAERRIHAPNGAATLHHRLPQTRTWRVSTPGPCRATPTADAAMARRSAQVAQFLAQAAAQDQPAALAAIEAAHALAAR
jgi:hypothetical protein